jgi:hypothetical protein
MFLPFLLTTILALSPTEFANIQIARVNPNERPTCLTYSNYQKTSHYSLYAKYCDEIPTKFRLNSGKLLCTQKYFEPKSTFIQTDDICIIINPDQTITGTNVTDLLFTLPNAYFEEIIQNNKTMIKSIQYSKCLGVNKKTLIPAMVDCSMVEPYFNQYE